MAAPVSQPPPPPNDDARDMLADIDSAGQPQIVRVAPEDLLSDEEALARMKRLSKRDRRQ